MSYPVSRWATLAAACASRWSFIGEEWVMKWQPSGSTGFASVDNFIVLLSMKAFVRRVALHIGPTTINALNHTCPSSLPF